MTDDGWRPGAPGFPERREKMSEREEMLELATWIEDSATNPHAPSFPDMIEGNWKLIVKALRAPAATSPHALRDVRALLQAIYDLIDDEEAAEPLDYAIAHAKKALDILDVYTHSHPFDSTTDAATPRLPIPSAALEARAWTSDEFWEYVHGLTDSYFLDNMRATLAERGLTIVSVSRPHHGEDQ